jgi:hypothetical protein
MGPDGNGSPLLGGGRADYQPSSHEFNLSGLAQVLALNVQQL